MMSDLTDLVTGCNGGICWCIYIYICVCVYLQEGKLVVVFLAVPGVILFLFSLGFWQREIFDTNIERAIFKPLVENTAEGNQFFAHMMRRVIVLVAVLLFQLLFIGIGFVVLEALGEPLVVQQEGEPPLPGGRAEYFLMYVRACVISHASCCVVCLLLSEWCVDWSVFTYRKSMHATRPAWCGCVPVLSASAVPNHTTPSPVLDLLSLALTLFCCSVVCTLLLSDIPI